MKVSGFALLILTLTFMILTKILVSNQENKISDIEERIKGIKKEIDEIQTDISYSTRPKKLEEINISEFGLVPIEQKDIIIELEGYGTE